MDELEQIVIDKITKYTGLYEVAKTLEQEENQRFYAKSVGKLNEILNILKT